MSVGRTAARGRGVRRKPLLQSRAGRLSVHRVATAIRRADRDGAQTKRSVAGAVVILPI